MSFSNHIKCNKLYCKTSYKFSSLELILTFTTTSQLKTNIVDFDGLERVRCHHVWEGNHIVELPKFSMACYDTKNQKDMLRAKTTEDNIVQLYH